jgi:hypothetical protein
MTSEIQGPAAAKRMDSLESGDIERMSTTPVVLDADATSLGAAQANQLASSTIMVSQLNSNLKFIYLTAFNNWKISVDAGRIPNTDPPQPPCGYEVSAPDANGFQWPVVGKTPVCDVPPIPVDHFTVVPLVPNTIDVGKNIGGKWFSVGAKDTFQAGNTTPPNTVSEDGVTGSFEKYGAPVGAGWYLQVA